MNDTLYVVRYTSPLGFIKPWTAVRDGEAADEVLTRVLRRKLEAAGFEARTQVPRSW